MYMMFVPHRKHSLLQESFTFSYVDDVRTSHETYASTAGLRRVLILHMYMMFVPHRKHSLLEESFTFSYVDEIRTSQETRVFTER
jgi:hypothetical protein